MCKLKVLPAFLIVAVLFFGCGDLDLALSSGKTYKVNALVNGLSLDECAILSNESRVLPYLDFNVKGDPDIASLVIYLKDYMGKEAGFRTRYNFAVQGNTDTASGEDIMETDAGADSASITEDDGSQTAFSGEDANSYTVPTTDGGTASTDGYTTPTTDSGTASTDGYTAPTTDSGAASTDG
ncbi:MAG: hypothetical protein LBD44_03350 [Spirochaetaceae bacterium]|jgi:hypothetical protein|nr:hypothetical protein [Spirochaetaceae bacterium]